MNIELAEMERRGSGGLTARVQRHGRFAEGRVRYTVTFEGTRR